MSAPLLRVEDLHVRFGGKHGTPPVRAVDGVSFDIAAGETLGLVGESGSGKSTIARAIVQVEHAAQGKIQVNGRLVQKHGRRELLSQVQMIFQDPKGSLDPRQTVAQALDEALVIHRLVPDRRERAARLPEMLEQVGLNPAFLHRYPHMLSGGQQQRVSIARALAVSPALLLCDEPVSSLDVSIQAQVVNLLKRLQQELNLAMLFVAHDLAVVRHVSDRVAVIYLGALVEIRPAEELFARPLHPYTRALIDAVPVPDARRERSRTRLLLTGDIPSPAAVPSGCRFRTRCPFAQDRCRDEVPVLRTIGGTDGQVACHFAEELITAGLSAPA